MKIFTIVAALFICMQSQAQTIPNAGFENWSNITGWFDDPDNWETNNTQLMTPVVQDSNAYLGDFAMQVNYPGYAYIRFPVAQHPQMLAAYVKTNILSGDSVAITVSVYDNDVIVDSVKWMNDTSITTWWMASIAIPQNNPNADSVEIRVDGGDQIGTSISVDDLSFLTTNLKETSQEIICNFFPNPAYFTAILDVKYDNENKFDWLIYNTEGQLIKQNHNLKSGNNIIDLNDLVAGFYMYKIIISKEMAYSGKFIVQ